MKIHVVGNCQAIPLAACAALMNPGVRVERARTLDGRDVAADDIVFRQARDGHALAAAERRGNEIVYPLLWFRAFHPDFVPSADASGPVRPPLGQHSSLVLYAWHRGLSVAETLRLFCEPVFERLGFFDCRDASRRALLGEGRRVGFPLDEMLPRWERRGRFMHTSNHPVLFVMADIARELMRRAGLPVPGFAPEEYAADPMLDMGVWAVYPEIALRLGVPGSYAFKRAKPSNSPAPAPLLSLRELVEHSFEAYAHMPPSALACARLEHPAYRDLEQLAATARTPPARGVRNGARSKGPYAAIPPSQFWRDAVERVPAHEVDPVGAPRFAIDRAQRIATVGSCFAQNMSPALLHHGFNYFVAEPAPDGLPAGAARAAGYGVFSTRCGNVYTARQLLQLFERAYGTFVPAETAWLRPDGRYADPFRPRIEPDGFATVDAVERSREAHLSAVRAMFGRLDVLIVTLGLTEAWRATADGAVFPLAPGVAAGEVDFERFEFVNFSAEETRDDLDALLARLAAVNPGAKVVLTVSPQPPVATYEPRHVLVSGTFTKAALRAACDAVERRHPAAWYFPAFEIVTGSFSRGAYYAHDLRTVTPEGVEHVMRTFFAHCAAGDATPPSEDSAALEDEYRAQADVVCDEDEIAGDGAPPARDADAAPPAQWFTYSRFAADDDDAPGEDGAAAAASAGRMDRLPRASMRVRIRAVLPTTMRARGVVIAPCDVENRGDTALLSGGHYPVFMCYRWYDEHGEPAEVGESIHSPLPAPVEPGASVSVPVKIAAPRYDGRYRLHVTLLQPEVAWFDDVDPRNRLVQGVDVLPAPVAAG